MCRLCKVFYVSRRALATLHIYGVDLFSYFRILSLYLSSIFKLKYPMSYAIALFLFFNSNHMHDWGTLWNKENTFNIYSAYEYTYYYENRSE